MKNKKLFAILTLVCFMMTLMPVAAFAAYGSIEEQYTVVKVGEKVEVKVTTAPNYYVYATKDGQLASLNTFDGVNTKTTGQDIFGLNVVATTASTDTINVTFAKAGEYNIGVAEATTALKNVIEGSAIVAPATVLTYLETFAIDMLDSTVLVGAQTATYEITHSGTTLIPATNGFDKELQTVTLKTTPSGVAIPNATLEIVTDSHAIDVYAVDSKTRADGTLRFYVAASIPGDYNIYVKHPAAADLVIPVTAGAASVNAVETVKQPSAPKDVTVKTTGAGMVFKITDATGYVYTSGVTTSAYKVSVLEAPKGFYKNTPLFLAYSTTSAGWIITGTADNTTAGVALDKEGKYTFQVSLVNGSKATASVEVSKFDKAVALKFGDLPTTVAYDAGTVTVDSTADVYVVDAKGVEKLATGVVVTANGKVVSSYTDPTLTLVAPAVAEKYIGSTITLLANLGNKLVATHEIVVTEAASTIVYGSTEVPVGANKVLAGKVYDEEGKFVAASGTADVVVLAKPENAIASVSVANGGAVTNGKFGVNFLANVAGEYKIQTIVVDGSNRYFTDVTTITVGAAEGSFKDVIVLSIGSNNMIKNGEVGSLLAAPEIVDGRTMIPMRAGLEAFGAKVDWNEADRSIKAEMNGVTVVMTLDSLTYTVNGKVMTADAAPYIKNGSTMVPAVFFTKAFGITATPLYDANGVCDVLFSK